MAPLLNSQWRIIQTSSCHLLYRPQMRTLRLLGDSCRRLLIDTTVFLFWNPFSAPRGKEPRFMHSLYMLVYDHS
jgi:hypothetical protein